MKKIFLSPFFAPAFYTLSWGLLLFIVLFFFNAQKFEITTDGQIIDILTYTGYVLMLLTMLFCIKDFKGKMFFFSIYLTLVIAALLREAGIQHHLTKTDTTPFKSRFFLNPDNPLSEKIIFGAVLIIIFGALLYLAFKYSKHLIVSFFKFDTLTWSIATFCSVLVFAKFADRFPSNWRHLKNLTTLDREFIDIWSLLEESSELFLPYLVIICFIQYHLITSNSQTTGVSR
ncbi:MAG: hypothetical protein J6S61_01715 [Elusimicrobiaceae bacterium]|nr:hypothetical protein [Elusimicrobiaceae bacterium]